MWNDENREDFFCDNDKFIKNYCSEQTRNVLRDNRFLNNSDKIEKIRKIILDLTKYLPYASHNSPNYGNTPPASNPVIVFGNAQNNFHAISDPAMGIGIDKHGLIRFYLRPTKK
jgi:hypothetical protein